MLTLNYLARDTSGRAYVVSALLSEPVNVFSVAAVAAELQGIIRGAFALAARASH